MKRLSGWTLAGVVAVGALAPCAAFAAAGDAALMGESIGRLTTVQREEVYDFTKRPGVRVQGSGEHRIWVITFAVKAKCDVAVAIEDADPSTGSGQAGKMVRHIVYGVLGSNAPEPFTKDALEQTVIWDGKDDMGRSVADPSRCKARVSLGLEPVFDHVYGYHPKDSLGYGAIHGLAADEHGVYVLQRCVVLAVLRAFDHQARYVRTLLPFSDAKLGTPEMNVPTVEVGGRLVPSRLEQFPGFLFRVVECTPRLAAASGWIVTLGDDGHLLRLKEDGTTGGVPYVGPQIPVGRQRQTWPWVSHLALSPDGNWVYVTGLIPGRIENVYRGPLVRPGDAWMDRVVFRVRRDAGKDLAELQPFIGTAGETAPEPDGKGAPLWFQGVACDAQGRIYVCDYGQDLIRIYDDKGSPVKTIPVTNPREIDVHKKTGEIYVMCELGNKRAKPAAPSSWGKGLPGGKFVLRKFGVLTEPVMRLEQEFPFIGAWPQCTPPLCVDSWSSPTRVWMTHRGTSVSVYVEKNGRWEMDDDFDKDVQDAGLTPHLFEGSAEWDDKFGADPVRGHIYLFDGFPSSSRMYRCDDLTGPGKFSKVRLVGAPTYDGGVDVALPMATSADGMLYGGRGGQAVKLDPAKSQVGPGGVVFPAGSIVPLTLDKPGKALKMSVGAAAVAPNGNVTASVVLDGNTRESKWVRWDPDGHVLAENVLSGRSGIEGLQTDSAGAIYLGINGYTAKHYPSPDTPEKLDVPFGIVAKFAAGSKVQPNEVSAKPGQTERLWSCPFYLTSAVGCGCPDAGLATDAYGRTFVPQPVPGTVAVLDTNGNRICAIGRYGNADSPDPATAKEPIKGADLRIAWCQRLATVSDRRVYILDDCNMRIAGVRLGYHTEERVPLP